MTPLKYGGKGGKILNAISNSNINTKRGNFQMIIQKAVNFLMKMRMKSLKFQNEEDKKFSN